MAAMPWARKTSPRRSPATSFCWSRPRSIRWWCMAAGRRSRRCCKRLGIQSEFAAGLRITDAATIEIVEMVLAGSINKQLVGYINEAGGKAVGLCGKDGNMVTRVEGDAHDGRSGFPHRKGGRSRLRRRAGKGRPDAAEPADRPRVDPGAGAAGDLARPADLQRQRRHLCRRGRRRAEGQAAVAADRRSRRARQVEEADPGTVGRRTRAS